MAKLIYNLIKYILPPKPQSKNNLPNNKWPKSNRIYNKKKLYFLFKTLFIAPFSIFPQLHSEIKN